MDRRKTNFRRVDALMNLKEEEEFIRHNIFREELYVNAHLPKEEFQKIFEQFKKDYKHLLSGKKPQSLGITGYQLRKHIKEKRGNF